MAARQATGAFCEVMDAMCLYVMMVTPFSLLTEHWAVLLF
jgi:hypothetical protein